MTRDKDIALAAAALKAGKLAAFPTETVYGLGADATSDQAVGLIFAAKNRPPTNPLIIHVESFEKARLLGEFGEQAALLGEHFWPGPLTLVVPKAKSCNVSLLATAGLNSIAIRVPAHSTAQELLRAFAKPVAAPSANLSGRLSPSTAEHVREQLAGKPAAILDRGGTELGLESTIISCLEGSAVLLRPGSLSREDIEAVLGARLQSGAGDDERPVSSGRMQHHYAPRATIRLEATSVQAGEALLAFGPDVPYHEGPMLNLSPGADIVEAASNLFAYLHRLDGLADRIAVMAVPEHGLGEAINDRLRRAAAPRNLDLSQE